MLPPVRHARLEVVIRRFPILRQLALAAVAAATVVVAADRTKPVFVGRTAVAERILHPTYVDSTTLRAPWLRLHHTRSVLTPQFLQDREAFAADLLRTGKVSRSRAHRIADAAVRQAYAERVPPALVLGVMMLENDEFKPRARSKVGAVGLMQIMPNVWRPTLGKKFGRDLHDDATNVRYGTFILGYLARELPSQLDADDTWRTALLRYNGCRRGTNTPDCRRYPDRVRRLVQRAAVASCGGRDFQVCVSYPLWLASRTAKPQAPLQASTPAPTPARGD